MSALADLDRKLLRQLAELINDTGLSEIEVESGDFRLRLAKQITVQATVPVAHTPAAPLAAQSPAAPTAEPAEPAKPVIGPDHVGAVLSPMVGTVYLASEPNSPHFVKVGDTVEQGQTLLIVEAMKVMNPIQAPRAGKVTHIMVTNGIPVEFGELLMIIE
ncbi:MAG: acetyl-CoA carboxylase biotin carboxyl carrier protein [Alphaproteobacteria bacterium]|nr:acetyl-CoA carboxylase biotin carboxyl carrier protein [Alphaproteobacteria bacterium]